MPGSIRVVRWEEFQHYKDRDPVWIKLHRGLLDNYEWSRLQDASKSHLIGIWLLAARHENRIPADPEWIAKRISASGTVDLQPLIAGGFIEVDDTMEQSDSTPLATCYARGEERREEENRGEETAPPRYERLLSKLPNTGGTRWAITEFLEKVPGGRSEGWMPILSACLDGLDMPGGRPCAPEQLATVCRDFMTKAEHQWTPKFFRTCVGALMREAARPIGKAPSAERESRSFEVARNWTPPKDPAA